MKTLMTNTYNNYNQDTNLDNTYATLNTADYDTAEYNEAGIETI
jgi:hypothetical protein